ncbi:MAG: putative nucleoprotein [Stang virus]|uniref:Nucleoprotein n=1 Tax=Stang virus TaxID=2800943 RepID=A0A894KPM6_9RHAB|nr:MAG: putative nucleoprotein [Stang virus]
MMERPENEVDVRTATKQALAELKNKKILDLAESPSTAKPTTWSSEEFKKTVTGYSKFLVPSNAEVIGHCLRFWTWYGGLDKPPKHLDMMACGILSSVNVGGSCIFHADLIGTSATTPESAKETEVNEYKFYKVGSALASTKNFTSVRGTISSDQCINWINAILRALRQENLGSNDDLETELRNLVRLTALVFLNCCRLATKDPQSVQEHLVATIIERAASLFSITMSTYSTSTVFAPPCHDFMVTFGELIRKGGDMSKKVLGRIIYSHVYALNDSESIRSVYRTGCLLSLSYTGLSPVSWLVKAARAKKLTQVELVAKLYISKMESFIAKYVALAREPDASWIYCRLMDESAYLGLSANMEPLATAVFVALCYNPKNPDMTVWSIPSLACITYEDVIRAHCIAEAMMDTSTCLSQEEAVVEEADGLVHNLRASAEGCYKKYYEKFGVLFNVEAIGASGHEVDPDNDESGSDGDDDEEGGPAIPEIDPLPSPAPKGASSAAAALAKRFREQ